MDIPATGIPAAILLQELTMMNGNLPNESTINNDCSTNNNFIPLNINTPIIEPVPILNVLNVTLRLEEQIG